jgi:hypothetical protein
VVEEVVLPLVEAVVVVTPPVVFDPCAIFEVCPLDEELEELGRPNPRLAPKALNT